MKEKIYVVYEGGLYNTKTFRTLEGAKKYFKEQVDAMIKNPNWDCYFRDFVDEDDNMTYSEWLEKVAEKGEFMDYLFLGTEELND